MRHSDFLEILDDLQNIINDDNCLYPLGVGKLGYAVYYSNNYFFVMRHIEISVQESVNESLTQTEFRSRLYYSEKVKDSIFLELIKLINYCKKNLGGNKKYNELLEKVRKLSDFQDVLECIR